MAKKTPVKLPPWAAEKKIDETILAMTYEELDDCCYPNESHDSPRNLRSRHFHPILGDHWKEAQAVAPVAAIDPYALTDEQAAALPEADWLTFCLPNAKGPDGRPESHPVNRISRYYRSGEHLADAERAEKRLKVPTCEPIPDWLRRTAEGEKIADAQGERVTEFRRSILAQLAALDEREAKEREPIVAARFEAERNLRVVSQAELAARQLRMKDGSIGSQKRYRLALVELQAARDELHFSILENLRTFQQFESQRGPLRMLLIETAPGCIKKADDELLRRILDLRVKSGAVGTGQGIGAEVGHMLHLLRALREVRELAYTVAGDADAHAAIESIYKSVPALGSVRITNEELLAAGFTHDVLERSER